MADQVLIAGAGPTGGSGFLAKEPSIERSAARVEIRPLARACRSGTGWKLKVAFDRTKNRVPAKC